MVVVVEVVVVEEIRGGKGTKDFGDEMPAPVNGVLPAKTFKLQMQMPFAGLQATCGNLRS